MFFSWGKPSKQKFASDLIKAIAELSGEQPYGYDSDNFCLINSDGEGVVNLANIHHEHCALPRSQRQANIMRIASIFGNAQDDLPEDFEDAKPNLRPKLWTRSAFDSMKLRSKIGGGQVPDIPLYPIGSHLYSSLVYDTENAMRSVSNENLEQWGTTYNDALEVAVDRLDETTAMMTKIGDGFYSFISGDNYDSSRIMLVGRREFDVDGDLIVTVPHRDVMYLAGSSDEASLKMMFELTAQDVEGEVRPLSPLPLKLVDGKWEDWVPPKNHVLRPQYDDLETQLLAATYADQKDLLETVFAQTDGGPFVASFSVMKKKDDERLMSFSVWSRDVDSLLPRSKYIVFVDEQGVAASAEWEHVESIVGGLLCADESYYPIRYRAELFPDDEQLKAIGTTEPFTA